MGLVFTAAMTTFDDIVEDAQIDDAILGHLPGNVAIGHTRYGTAGSSVIENAQPYLANTRFGPLGIAHNGNLTNAIELRQELVRSGAIFSSTSDTEALIHLIARSDAPDAESAIRSALERVDGAYTLLITVGRTIYAVVDSRGFRPMVLGKLGDGMVVGSESCALDLVGAISIREVRPGEFIKIEDGVVTDLSWYGDTPVELRLGGRCGCDCAGVRAEPSGDPARLSTTWTCPASGTFGDIV